MLLGKFGLSTDNFKVHKKDDGSFNLQFQNDA